ncbi:hypothetical protein FA04_32930 (plasmid) [Ensifer adhaerens]|uniref:Uncharacterized protein n=1 Tax=Ensifer adhaerens TaxID=106592 RepID=A0ABY8HT72_ENSAD|nr:hypothetical protein [Ensifer adhaerens]ANK77436.1 hypothetical protein FA04_32930 [Ensifer adhaerens]KDP73014.1 hypothetical protein FA04_14540 [Ensifer adhaerens]WFP94702.1 hypothetical protein P4B07_33425 [Ensifer adhaerens]
MIAEAPGGIVNKFALVRASRPPSADALKYYFINRPPEQTQLWSDLSAAVAGNASSTQLISVADSFLSANNVGTIPNFATFTDSSDVARLIGDAIREGDLEGINSLIKGKYADLFAQGGVGPEISIHVWDHLAARLISGRNPDDANSLFTILRLLHIAQYHSATQSNADERVFWADIVIPADLKSFIDWAQKDRRKQKTEAQTAAQEAKFDALVKDVKTALLARAGRRFLAQSISANEIGTTPDPAAVVTSDGQNDVVRTPNATNDFVLHAAAIGRLGAMPDLQAFLTSLSPGGVLATASIFSLSNQLDNAALAVTSTLLSPLSTSAMIQADRALEQVAESIARGAIPQIQATAEQLCVQVAFGAGPGLSSVLQDVSHPNPIQPAGIGDLKIVKQQLQKYALGEVAHIENVLAGEARERIHTLLDRTEQQIILETEETTESEKDLQSTDRFELSQELESIRKDEKQSEAGINVTASYGAVSMSANAKTSNSQAAEQSIKVSQKNVRETISRAIERIQKKTRRQQTVVMISERTETNKHSFASGDKSIVGLYRYVDKHYWCQVLNYGSRLMIEFWVPEPAAYYQYSQQAAPREQGNMIPPEEPNITAEDITVDNYKGLSAKYHADIPEPPKAFQFRGPITLLAEDQAGGGGPDSGKFTVPDDYEAVHAYATYVFQHVRGDGAFLTFAIGSTMWDTEYWASTKFFYPPLRKDIRLRGWGYNTTKWMCGVSLILQRTDEALSKWQLEAYAAISTSYKLAKEDFDRRIAEAKLGQQNISIRNDIEYRSIEKGELKRAALELLTNQHFDNFSSINLVDHVPVIDNSAALKEAPIVRFFEHSFEWENIVYTFYPYFWGRKSTWPEKLAAGNSDPVFARFLGAGYSRVVVPVRRGYENHVSLYITTGILWADGDAPVIGSPQYLSIIDEIKAIDSAISDTPDQEGVAEGAPWQIKLPTNLVCIDTDDLELPSWEVRPPGNPVPYVPSTATCDGVPYNAAQ